MFLFLTRTRDKDYRLFCDDGKLAGSSQEKIFMDNLRASGIPSTEAPFTVLHEQDGKFYVLSGGMKTGGKDREGRPIRFSFCCECDERDEASKLFLTLAAKWDEAVNVMRSCLEEKRDEVKFSHVDFMNWLKTSQPDNLKLNLQNHSATSKSTWPKIFCAVILGIAALLGWYTVNLKQELTLSQNKIISLTSKLAELHEIPAELSKVLELMNNAYNYIDMINIDTGNASNDAANSETLLEAKLASEYSRREAGKAKVLLESVAGKIASFKFEE